MTIAGSSRTAGSQKLEPNCLKAGPGSVLQVLEKNGGIKVLD